MTTHHMGVSEGPACRFCGTSEAHCARLEIRCCGEECTHFTDLDEHGNTPAPAAAPDAAVVPLHRYDEIAHLLPVSLYDIAAPTGALCAETNPEIFFPEKGGSTRAAKALCRKCGLREECLEWGLTERFGIWGGYSERERRRICQERGIHIPIDQESA